MQEAIIEAQKKFNKYLKNHKQYLTYERKIILDEVFSKDCHFDAEELVDKLKTGPNCISRATVYRTLGMLEKTGLIRKMYEGERHAHYEFVHDYTHHGHLLCAKCGKVIEIDDVSSEVLWKKICDQKHFTAKSFNFQIVGICADCQSPEHRPVF